jgi:prepilin-type processing-associated H-X9-DG protein
MKDRLSYIRKRQKPPFTLVELLVVMVIILILAAMLLPALNKAKGSAHTAVCNSNLGQFGKILGMYSTDTDGTFAGPIVGDGTTCSIPTLLDDKSVWWQVYHEAGYYGGADTTATDYWLSVGINWCPSDIEFKTADMSTTVTYADAGVDANAWNPSSPNSWSPLGSTYGCFMWYRAIESNAANLCVSINNYGTYMTYGSDRGWRASPSAMPILGDSRHAILGAAATPSAFAASPAVTTPFYGLGLRHGVGDYNDGAGTANVLFFDGHVSGRNAWAINPNYTSVAVGFINNITESTLLMEQEGVVWKGAGYPGQNITYGNPVFTW